MVVAARAAERQAEKRLRGGAHDIVELIESIRLRIGRLVVPGAEPIEACGDQCLGIAVRQFVARQLLQNETIVGLVLIERADHVIAITPGMRL